jgi:hypothetical protein
MLNRFFVSWIVLATIIGVALGGSYVWAFLTPQTSAVIQSASDLSPKFHPVESRIRSSFGPVRPGVATAWGAKPVVERSAPGCCGTEALRAA